jgi:uncharacterized repeat protein (TIGR01451 family)
MSTGRAYHTATLLSDGRVLVTGGYEDGGGGGYLSSAEVYNPASGTWSSASAMSAARSYHTATLLPDRRVLVSGGYNDSGYLSSAEVYDPVTGSWSPTGSMSTSRYIHTATSLSDGRVLVSGGFSGSALGSAETYDPIPGTWSESGSMNAPRYLHTATRLSDGRVLVSGGEADNVLLTSAEIYGSSMDTAPPTITIASPLASATYQLKSIVGANYFCVDGGSGIASCQGPVANASPIDTSSTGAKTFTVTSADQAGNPSTLSVTYSVVNGGGGTMSADLGITQSAPAKVSSGGTLTYSMTVTNSGKLTAIGVVVADALPGETVFASASSSQGTVTAPLVGNNGTVIVSLGNLAKGETANINIVVTVTGASGTLLTNTATVTATTQDVDTDNNSATKKTTVTKN